MRCTKSILGLLKRPVVVCSCLAWISVCGPQAGIEAQSVDGTERPIGALRMKTSDKSLAAAFEWAHRQALAYAFSGDPVGDWYEAALPGREAFCMRDVSHQSMGAHALGLSGHTQNMLRKFAENISESKDWCSYWEIDRYGLPARVDYKDDTQFWYNLPANFDVLDCCYRMYLWTGDRTYIEDPVFLNFYRRTVYDYVDRWELSLDRIMTRMRILNIRGRFDPQNRFQVNRGIPSYDEGAPDFVVAADQLAVQVAGYTAYARIQQLRGNDEEAQRFLAKAREMKAFLNDVWWDDDNRRYYSHLNEEYDLVHKGFSRSIPYYNAHEDGIKLRSVLNAIVQGIQESPGMGIEGQSHLPEILYRYGETEAAYGVLLDVTRNRRSEYPEASFAAIGAVVTGLMGISLEVHPPDEALTWGGYVDRILTTIPGLTGSTAWAELEHLTIRANVISARHEGTTRTILTNNSGPSLLWKARFPGSFESLRVDGRPVQATRDEIFPGGPEISWVTVTVGAGEAIEVEVSDSRSPRS